MPLLNNFLYEYFIMRKKIKKRGVGYKKSYQTLTSSEKKKEQKERELTLNIGGKSGGRMTITRFLFYFFLSIFIPTNHTYLIETISLFLSFFLAPWPERLKNI